MLGQALQRCVALPLYPLKVGTHLDSTADRMDPGTGKHLPAAVGTGLGIKVLGRLMLQWEPCLLSSGRQTTQTSAQPCG